ncbi:MAG TPA: hypothetical protein VF763_13135, partial [Candidatus Limnocylindrales bacterium]
APTGWAAYVPPPEPGPRFALRVERSSVPGVRAVVLGTFDLLRSADRELRAGSVHIVVQLWLIGLPLVLVAWGLLVAYGPVIAELEAGKRLAESPLTGAEVSSILAVSLLAALGLVALSLESQLLAAIGLAARRMGAPIDLPSAVELSRRRFWPLVRATLAVFIFASLPAAVVSVTVAAALGAQRFLVAQTAQLVTGLLIGTPFTYTAVACAVAGYGAVDAIRVSFRLAARRWRLAFAVAVLRYLAQLLVQLAASSGLDALASVAAALHPHVPGAVVGAVLGLGLAAVLLVVAGALVFAVNVAAVAPQVVAYAALAGLPTEGPEADLGAGLRPTRRISRPMLAAIVLAFVAAIPPTWAGIEVLLRS